MRKILAESAKAATMFQIKCAWKPKETAWKFINVVFVKSHVNRFSDQLHENNYECHSVKRYQQTKESV